MGFFKKVFFSYSFVILMLFILGVGAAIATFIENDYDSQTAKVLVYHALWYEVVMVFLAVSLIGLVYKRKMWRRLGAFVFHVGFVVVLIGAGVTRYFGYEGVLHVREGMSEYKVISEESYLQINTENQSYEHLLALGKIGNNNFKFEDKIEGKNFIVEFKEYQYFKITNVDKLTLKVTYNGQVKEIEVRGGHGSIEPPSSLYYDGLEVQVSWGSKLINLPFKIKLEDFQIDRYPGSMSPSSYASEVTLIDEKENINVKHRIFMNHPLSYKGFKFFQSSYDRDELGTILSVNNDPGKWPTYLGYFLLSLGFVLNFFTKGSRFSRLKSFLHKSNLSLMIVVLMSFSTCLKADALAYIEKYKVNSLEHSKAFGKLLVQDYNGRIKPMSTESIDVMHKMSGKDSLLGLKPEQIMLGILADPLVWEDVKLIKIKNKKIKKLIGIRQSEKYISFSDIFKENGEYKLKNEVDEANAKAPAKRGTFDKDLIKLDERLNIFYMASKGFFTKFIPKPNDEKNTWYSPQDASAEIWLEQNIRETLYTYIKALKVGIKNNDWAEANKALKALKNNQLKYSSDILPTKSQLDVEILFNKLKIFQKLISFYFILGFIILVIAIISIFFEKNYRYLNKIFFYLLLFGFLFHSAGILMRWYISNHAPWSDTYESLIYIGWSTLLAGLIVFRKSLLALSASALLGGVIMLVAHLNFISPQITTLVPVLKSYWLSIHVSVITASYGFLGLGALLAFIALVLMIFRNQKNEIRLDIQIRQISAITEISLIIGLSLLTVGNFIGGVWANESWGRYWGWDPKETWSFISIVVYTMVLHLRFIPKLNTIYVFSVASVISFASIIMTYFGVNFYLSGLHSYASGDKVPVPNFVYYMILIVLIIASLAYRGRAVKVIK
ncbi:cytochrome c biogenesis protein CcsA [Sulfurospirillum arcachonense]|uniref:cytochrome c biogenesis protein CcsA n=1 Tax=Sulfurospirillum arcachonense TaxID=57666 RepID=UPI00046A3FE3|nr:cytochrome c biogenesis protein CcsA [Sulfurospirillum arcachonense]